MLQNAYSLAKIGADTAEIERNFAENWQLPYRSTTLRASGAARPGPGSGAGAAARTWDVDTESGRGKKGDDCKAILV